MRFVQHIVFRTDDIDAVQRASEEYDREQAPGNPTIAILRDRDVQGRYIAAVTFSSFEEAMRNNERPETQQWAARFRELIDGEPEYLNLDLIAEA